MDKEKNNLRTSQTLTLNEINSSIIKKQEDKSSMSILVEDKPDNEPKREKTVSIKAEAELPKQKDKVTNERIRDLEDLLEKEREINRQFKLMHQRIVEEKIKEVKDKDKSLQSITVTNSRLMQTLEELRKEVDEQFDKMSVSKLKKKEENKPNPLDIVIKVKEKELKNANQLIEILRKDNEQLNKNLENYSEFKNVIELQDKVTLKDKEIAALQVEIKLLNKTVEEHKKCTAVKQQVDNEVRQLKDEYKVLKETYKNQQIKIKEDEKSHQKLVGEFFNLKKEIKAKDNVKDLKDTVAIDKLLAKSEKKKIQEFNHDPNLQEVLDDTKTNPKNKNVKSIGLKIKKTEEEKISLFTSEEKAKIEKILSKSEIEKLEKKYETLEHSKASVQFKHKSDVKVLSKRISEQEERFDFLNLQLKEVEQKYKINSFQVNEYKNEQKAYQRKLVEVQGQIEALSSQVREKEQENKLLMSQLNSFRKIVKHNAVPPMDNEIVRHLEKIKNEESNMNSFNNELNDILGKGGNDSIHKGEHVESNLFLTGGV